MERLHPKRKMFLSILLLCIIICGFINFTPIAEPIRLITLDTLKPLIALGAQTGQKTRSFFVGFTRLHSVQSDYNKLEEENASLKAKIGQIDILKKENDRLRESVKLLPTEKFTLLGTNVIGNDLYGGSRWILIDRGTQDGLKKNMVVIVGDSVLVGHITEVSKKTARVQLITHNKSILKIQSAQNNTQMISRGDHGSGVIASEIPRDATIEVGSILMTSRSENAFNDHNLGVGIVQEIHVAQDQLSQTAFLKPLFTPLTLKEVFVILQ